MILKSQGSRNGNTSPKIDIAKLADRSESMPHSKLIVTLSMLGTDLGATPRLARKVVPRVRCSVWFGGAVT